MCKFAGASRAGARDHYPHLGGHVVGVGLHIPAPRAEPARTDVADEHHVDVLLGLLTLGGLPHLLPARLQVLGLAALLLVLLDLVLVVRRHCRRARRERRRTA